MQNYLSRKTTEEAKTSFNLGFIQPVGLETEKCLLIPWDREIRQVKLESTPEPNVKELQPILNH